MAKKQKTFSIQSFDVQHYAMTDSYVRAIESIYLNAVSDMAAIAGMIQMDDTKPFSFSDYPRAKNAASAIFSSMYSSMRSVIRQAMERQWIFSNKKNDDFLKSILDTSKIDPEKLKLYQDRNLDALAAFQDRKTDGLGLSERIWNYANQFKDQMELGLDIGIGDGRSANELSRDLRSYLVDPDKLFRRVRDKWGNLQLSKNAKAFNPGQGKYRSSYKNAVRLTRTEVNMAYRASDYLRWMQLDFVIGYEVKLSNAHKITDICDVLKGKYPKEFKFIGWHSQCMCFCIPILMPIPEFDSYELGLIKSAIDGAEYSKYESPNAVVKMPSEFTDWVKENKEKSLGWKSQPYFVRDNFKDGNMFSGLKLAK